MQKLFDASKESGLGASPLKQSIAKKGPVFEYTAPEELGAGTVKVLLHRVSALWNEAELDNIRRNHPELAPDALAPGTSFGIRFTTLTIDTPAYCNHLLARFLARGGALVRASVQHLQQLAAGGPHACPPNRGT